MRTSELVINTEPTPDEVQFLEDRLYEFNSTATGITDGEWLAIFVRDDEHRVIAGICGSTWGGCLEIRQFWVEEARRKPAQRLAVMCTARGREVEGCNVQMILFPLMRVESVLVWWRRSP
jgi:hypothetical protein